VDNKVGSPASSYRRLTGNHIRRVETDTGIVGQDGILRASCQSALGSLFTSDSGGLPTRRRLPACPAKEGAYPLVRSVVSSSPASTCWIEQYG